MPLRQIVILILLVSMVSSSAPRSDPVWAYEASNLSIDPQFRFGRLANGMRYVIRSNARPVGTTVVRMEVSAGSLDEAESERGFAHFVEHMAFNGSSRVAEGEMVRLLQRNGLAFGTDANAETDFDRTTYKLDLPRNDPALLETALMLMRETATELTFAPDAVDRERGVILAEMRKRDSWSQRNFRDRIAFLYPASLYANRLPIGVADTVKSATAERLKAFWRREYVPAHTTLIVIGDFAPATVESAIKARFADWAPAPAETQPDAGPVEHCRKRLTHIHIDPALSEQVTASRHGRWLKEPDTISQRREDILRQVGYGIVNRRLQHASRRTDAPFYSAYFVTTNLLKSGRTTSLVVNTVDGKWRRGIGAAVQEYRRALRFGFSEPEVAEQVAIIFNAAQTKAATSATRNNAELADAALALLRSDRVPTTPQDTIERLEAFIPQVTPKSVLAALKREAVPLNQPLLRFQGRRTPVGGETAIRAAWNEGVWAPLLRGKTPSNPKFAYTNFGPPGNIASDTREPNLGIRKVRFANGVRLNIKPTEIQKGRVLVRLSIDGGNMLNTIENPLATEMTRVLPAGGLGKHSPDELQSILAGHTVAVSMASTPETFIFTSLTTPRDLALQLQLYAAFISDPGYRVEGEVRYRLNMNHSFAQARATPLSALRNSIGGILSDNDPRFTRMNVEQYRSLTFAKLKFDLADRLAHGAIEIGIVGDVNEEQAIGLVASTIGALPQREANFRAYAHQRTRPFSAERSVRILRHSGPADLALIRLTWPTRDDNDAVETTGLKLLERIVKIELTETLREDLGESYSPSANSAPSPFWREYGTFGLAASLDTRKVPAVRAAIANTIARLRDTPLNPDELRRARQPLIMAHDNALKSNAGWLTLVDRAQTEVGQIDRFRKTRENLLALTPADIQRLAKRYLDMPDAIEILVLPEEFDLPGSRLTISHRTVNSSH